MAVSKTSNTSQPESFLNKLEPKEMKAGKSVTIFLLLVMPLVTWASNVTLVEIPAGEPGSSTNPLRPSEEATIFIQTDTPMLIVDAILTITSGSGIITGAIGLSDCADYGWDPLFAADPIITGNEAEIGVGNLEPNPAGIVGYFVVQGDEIGLIVVDLSAGYGFGGSYDWMFVPPEEISGQLSIYVTSEPAPLTVLSPHGGEVLTAGSTHTINWLGIATLSEVLIEYSTDNAQSWIYVDTVPNTGSYEWFVPEEYSKQCLVRISDVNDPDVSDTSDSAFTIGGTICVQKPNNDHVLIAGSTYTITWSSTGPIENVLIEYSTDKGQSWNDVNAVPNTGSYNWLVPILRSNECLLRISDKGEPEINDTTDGLFAISWELHVPGEYSTIQAAINAAIGGDIVVLDDGIYTGPGNRDINFLSKNITVRSRNGPESCIIDCNGTPEDPHQGFIFTFKGDIYSMISGLTITNAYSSRGAAVYSFSSSQIGPSWGFRGPLILNCIITGNHAIQQGGGIYGERSGVRVLNSKIINNYAARGGGAYFTMHSRPYICNSLIADNRGANVVGSGLSFFAFACPTIVNCTITKNNPKVGIWLYQHSDAYFVNSIVRYNEGGDIHISQSVVNIRHSAVDPSRILGSWNSYENIYADPCFIDAGYWDANGVWIDGDYHLRQTSACINAADNNSIPIDTQDLDGDSNTTEQIPFDIEGNPRVVYNVVDMGAFEFDNKPPVANAGPDRIVECACNTEESIKVTLDGTNSSDPDYGVLTYTWTGPFLESPAQGAAPTVTLETGCPGEYVITLVVNDGIDDSEPNEVVITVVDTTPPQFQLSVEPTMLWPPDHKMVVITPSWTVSDKCDQMPDVSLVSIVANEGDNTIGDGHTTDDIQINEDGSIYLRSERSGTGNDRIYTITYQAVDDCGNTTIRSATVSIPHDFKVLARIASRWLWSGPAGRIPEDLNGDGIVNLADVARFAGNWTK